MPKKQIQSNKKIKFLKILMIVVLIAISGFFNFKIAEAQKASLYFYPSTGNYSVGSTFLVQVKVNTGGLAINAAEGRIIFDPAKLEVVNLSKSNSIFSMWIGEPTFSNTSGFINFAGGKPSPGFIGTSGTIISITFRVKGAGKTNLNFVSSSVLADDGSGTNILGSVVEGVYNLESSKTDFSSAQEESSFYQSIIGPPEAPLVKSPECSEESQWCSKNSLTLEWQLPSNVLAVSYSLDKNSTTEPREVFSVRDSVSFSNLEDGVWYFHINFKNSYGWGKLTHRKLMIDTQPPALFEIEVQQQDPTDPQPILFFDTKDELSGVEYYEIKIGEGDAFSVRGLTKENPLRLPPQAPGKHQIIVRAFDKAGNFTDAKTEIEILPLPTPQIKSCPKNIYPNSVLNLKGFSLANGIIRVFLQKDNEEPILKEIKADGKGEWNFISDPLKEGQYKTWVEAKDSRGALSLPSTPCEFSVGLPLFLKFGKIAIDYLSIIITLLILLIFAIFLIFYTWYRIYQWKKKIKSESEELNQTILRAFNTLKEEIQNRIEYLDGKPGLSVAETKVRDKLKKSLEIVEKFVEKELKDILKELD